MAGRTLPVYQRVYIDGYDMSGYTVDTGEQGVTFGEPDQTTFTDVCKGTLPTRPTITYGPLNGVLITLQPAVFMFWAYPPRESAGT